MYLQLGAAILVNNIIGGLWYSPLMFGDTFIETSGRKKEDCHMGWGHVVGTLIFALMEVLGLYYVITIMKTTSLLEAAKYAYFAWQFFVCPTIGVHFIFDGRSIKELLSKWGHHLTTFALEAVVMQALA